MNKVIVIGGGAAGMVAALAAAKEGAKTILLEKNEKLGKKLYITGKGRCNITNACDTEELFLNVPRNAKFLYSAFYTFDNFQVMRFFEEHGLQLKTERGNRVFPESDHSSDVIRTLQNALKQAGVEIRLFTEVKQIITGQQTVQGVCLKNGEKLYADAVIVATGGFSYQSTGSTGDGYRIARDFGLDVSAPEASLVPIVTVEDTSPMMGLALKNAVFTVKDGGGKKVFAEQGEILFTHFGISGPLALSASAHMRPDPAAYSAEIDMKCALDGQTLDRRILSDLSESPAKALINSLGALLPSSIIAEVVRRSGVDPYRKCAQITKEERAALGKVIKHFTLTPRSFRPIDEAIVTSGGVSVAELSPKTMMSKKIGGLFFAGEVIDVDAYTGGYNLQIAFSTGHAAGEGAADFVLGM